MGRILATRPQALYRPLMKAKCSVDGEVLPVLRVPKDAMGGFDEFASCPKHPEAEVIYTR